VEHYTTSRVLTMDDVRGTKITSFSPLARLEMDGRVLADNDVRIQASDDVRVTESLQKVANRIALGIVLASLIMGAALLMRIESGFRTLEYPGLAMLMFVAAAGLGFALVLNILVHDEWARREK
jgi:ubiquinone biosynthesis protein